MPAEPAAATACVVLMFKAPQRSKQRLAAEIGTLASDAAGHLLDCALEDLASWPGPICFAPASDADRACVDRRIDARAEMIVQQGDNLGARINHVNRALLRRGLQRQIFIGIDCPRLDADYLERAAAALRDHDVVLGPASDGGVVLMASRCAWPDLRPLPWGGAHLMSALEQRCIAGGHRLCRLEALSDIDSLSDLRAARAWLGGDARPARRRLSGWLADNLPRQR